MGAGPKKRLGELLIEAGLLDAAQLQAALGHQRRWGVRLGQALVDLKILPEADIVRALSLKLGFEVARLDVLEPYALEQALRLVPREFAVRHNVLPMSADTALLTVAMSDPTNLAVVDELRFRTGLRVKVCVGGDHEIAAAVRLRYPGEHGLEAIALDLEAGDIAAEQVLDPFGGGSKDALEAFFSAGPSAAPGPAAPRAAPPPEPPARPSPEGGPAARGSDRGHDRGVDLEGLTPEAMRLARAALLGTVPPGGLAAPEEAHPAAPPPPAFTQRERAVLDALARLAGGAPAEPEIVKPAQAMAVIIRLLIRRGIVSEREFLDELQRR